MTENSDRLTNRTRRVMIDIETVGLEIGAAIVEIGAVQFAPGGQVGETFHRSISLTSSQEAGLNIDADTVEWWVGEQPEAASEVLVGGDDLQHATGGEVVDRALRLHDGHRAAQSLHVQCLRDVYLFAHGLVVRTEQYRPPAL